MHILLVPRVSFCPSGPYCHGSPTLRNVCADNVILESSNWVSFVHELAGRLTTILDLEVSFFVAWSVKSQLLAESKHTISVEKFLFLVSSVEVSNIREREAISDGLGIKVKASRHRAMRRNRGVSK